MFVFKALSPKVKYLNKLGVTSCPMTLIFTPGLNFCVYNRAATALLRYAFATEYLPGRSPIFFYFEPNAPLAI